MVVGTQFKPPAGSSTVGVPMMFLCEAMGYTLLNTLTDPPGAPSIPARPNAVVQVNPFAYGTNATNGLAATFVECVP
jgi:hypothetical protein